MQILIQLLLILQQSNLSCLYDRLCGVSPNKVRCPCKQGERMADL